MSAISLSKLDRDLADNKISRDEYIEKCKIFFKRKREQYKETYHRRKLKDFEEEYKGEEEILRLQELRKNLHTEKYSLKEEITQYQHVITLMQLQVNISINNTQKA